MLPCRWLGFAACAGHLLPGRRAASYVDRILRGAAVQLPTKFEMAVNLKTGGMAGDVRRHAAELTALAPDVIMAQHLDRDAVSAGDSHILSRDEWTGGDV